MEQLNQLEIIDIEEHAKNGKAVSHGHRYRIRIDKTQYVVHVPRMTGRQLLELAAKIPISQYRIFQKLRGGHTEEIIPDQEADFTAPGVERFVTLATDQTEG